MKMLKVTFLDTNDAPYNLFFLLHKTTLADRWQKLLKENQKNLGARINSNFMNYTCDTISPVLDKINQLVDQLNQIYDRPLHPCANLLDNSTLNDLHEEYEIYGSRITELTENKIWSENLHNNFLALNDCIHACEGALDNKKFGRSAMGVLFDYYPQGIHSPILEQDKLFLTTNFSWGKLYLGYNTLGKDWLEVSLHNDLDVIRRGEVRIQERFAVEAWLNFSSGPSTYVASTFLAWYDTLPADVKDKVPVGNLNQLSLGRYEIGQIVIDNKLEAYHSNHSDWFMPNSPVAESWNNEVFSTFQQIINLELIER